ncbi:MAG: zinc-binding dehydrogenase [Chthonomonadales bacterium]|nr:zinc-binding dehydrogenase [Chthonomonadales bacterium]
MNALEHYKSGKGPIPERMLKWHLYGEGLDNLKLEEVPVPEIGPDELLVRQDANGLCFSDTKVIALGNNHPRMQGRDLSTDPATLGHEVAITVVKVGEQRRGQFNVGDRFIVQADVFYKGVSMAYGYAISGGLAPYSVIPTPMIDGDEGCYLLPVDKNTGYAETALVEPWACVVGAYNQSHRTGPAPDGTMLILAGAGADDVQLDGVTARSGTVVVMGPEGPAVAQRIANARTADTDDVAATVRQQFGDAKLDDILVLGHVAPEMVESAAAHLADRGVVVFCGTVEMPRKLTLDIGRIHYNWHHYLGTTDNDPLSAYREPRGADLKPGGIAWFIGAGGPMGQMHVQRAVMHRNPPSVVVGTDIDGERLGTLVERFSETAKRRGVQLIAINPREMNPEAFDARLRELTGGRGFDDIVSLVPVPALIEHATGFLADGAWFNVFAGVARGTMAALDVNDIRRRGVRYIGSSGSSIADMKQTLAMVESGELSTNASLAAIGGMRAAREGLAGVRDGRFPGKTLVFPLIQDMPLMALPELQNTYPTVYAKLDGGKFWTREAEDELLRLTIAREGE